MKPFKRAERVGGLIQRTLADILQKQIKDPRIQTTTITGVKVSSDLRLARVYFIASGGVKTKTEAIEGYKNALGYIKRILAQELDLRYVPEIQFYYDESFDYGFHIDKVLKSLKTDNA